MESSRGLGSAPHAMRSQQRAHVLRVKKNLRTCLTKVRNPNEETGKFRGRARTPHIDTESIAAFTQPSIERVSDSILFCRSNCATHSVPSMTTPTTHATSTPPVSLLLLRGGVGLWARRRAHDRLSVTAVHPVVRRANPPSRRPLHLGAFASHPLLNACRAVQATP